MATINLGAIKFNWKGAYNSSTSYAVDDVVSSGGNSYVCIQAHSNQAVGNATAYWNIMSSAGTNGTNGTDVGTTLTTQSDLLYRDGSGLQRLPKGTANQLLRINSGATAPEWATVDGGKVLMVTSSVYSQRVALSNTSTYNYFSFNHNQQKANSKIKLEVQLIGHSNNNGFTSLDFVYDNVLYPGRGAYTYSAQNNIHNLTALAYINGASSTGNKTATFRHSHATGVGTPFNIWNPTSADDNRMTTSASTMVVTEYDF
jgi:hypothetical protein